MIIQNLTKYSGLGEAPKSENIEPNSGISTDPLRCDEEDIEISDQTSQRGFHLHEYRNQV
jgi:hypothetical protein